MSDKKHTTRSASRRVHIISREKGWAIKKEGVSRASQVHQNKEAAVKSARRFKRRGLDVVVHRRDGSIERWEKAKR
jgi:hypothetical protein